MPGLRQFLPLQLVLPSLLLHACLGTSLFLSGLSCLRQFLAWPRLLYGFLSQCFGLGEILISILVLVRGTISLVESVGGARVPLIRGQGTPGRQALGLTVELQKHLVVELTSWLHSDVVLQLEDRLLLQGGSVRGVHRIGDLGIDVSGWGHVLPLQQVVVSSSGLFLGRALGNHACCLLLGDSREVVLGLGDLLLGLLARDVEGSGGLVGAAGFRG